MSYHINIKAELRPCVVRGKLALFHLFVHHQEPVHVWHGIYKKEITALVEFSEGDVKEVDVNDIFFLDSAGKFAEYDFSLPNKEETP